MNNIVISGNITADAEIKTVKGGSSLMATFTVAVNRQNGADFFSVTCFEPVSKNVETGLQQDRFKKGCHCEVSGEMRSSQYQSQQTGENRTSWSIVARYVKSDRRYSQQPNNGYPQGAPAQYQGRYQSGQAYQPQPQYQPQQTYGYEQPGQNYQPQAPAQPQPQYPSQQGYVYGQPAPAYQNPQSGQNGTNRPAQIPYPGVPVTPSDGGYQEAPNPAPQQN